jgi:hypothetical protein
MKRQAELESGGAKGLSAAHVRCQIGLLLSLTLLRNPRASHTSVVGFSSSNHGSHSSSHKSSSSSRFQGSQPPQHVAALCTAAVGPVARMQPCML